MSFWRSPRRGCRRERRGVEHEHTGDVTVDSRRLEREELRIEAGELAHGLGQHCQNPRRTVNSSHSLLHVGLFGGARGDRHHRDPGARRPELRTLHRAGAVVVDPQRDIDRVLSLLSDRGARLTHVVETHIHNDYVSGASELCRATGATLVIPAGESVGYPRRAIADGERIALGDVSLVARHTRAIRPPT